MFNIESATKLSKFTYFSVLISIFLLPILFIIYFNVGESEYSSVDNIYKVVATDGSESIDKIITSNTPITNLETTKEWLKDSLVEVMTYDAANYNSQQRKDKIEGIMDDNYFKYYLSSNISDINAEIKNGYLRSAAIISYNPVLLGEATSTSGKKMWKFYLEIQIKKESKYDSYPTYNKKYAQIIVKEIDPTKNFKGIGIAKISIK